ncbi:MAG: TPM domain-containing protein [Bacteroidota bacterium]|nr:TPM domain-containing protein [Bacteroidota bacterium]
MGITAKNFFSVEQQADILKAIQQAELNTSGEIRVHIENKCSGNALARSAYLFNKLGMTKTAQRNGVLFYLAVEHRKFAVLGDKGIDAVVPANFWDDVKSILQNNFKEGRFTEGLTNAISLAGELLKKHFPHQKDDINELPDDISFGNK